MLSIPVFQWANGTKHLGNSLLCDWTGTETETFASTLLLGGEMIDLPGCASGMAQQTLLGMQWRSPPPAVIG